MLLMCLSYMFIICLYNDDVDGVLAFSPASGGPMKHCKPDEYFETLKVPLLLLRPLQELEIESVKNQFELAQKTNHQVYIEKKWNAWVINVNRK